MSCVERSVVVCGGALGDVAAGRGVANGVLFFLKKKEIIFLPQKFRYFELLSCSRRVICCVPVCILGTKTITFQVFFFCIMAAESVPGLQKINIYIF